MLRYFTPDDHTFVSWRKAARGRLLPAWLVRSVLLAAARPKVCACDLHDVVGARSSSRMPHPLTPYRSRSLEQCVRTDLRQTTHQRAHMVNFIPRCICAYS